tara:strand:- start:708 stop:881 length:174 start_codon:yes stop_codon:yes gene_type:complete
MAIKNENMYLCSNENCDVKEYLATNPQSRMMCLSCYHSVTPLFKLPKKKAVVNNEEE